MVKLSVIMPVYNVEKYLKKALDSVLGQTFTEWELICINDGSTDSSLSILQEYAAADPRIRIINQENRGQGSARNSGIDAAKGVYIAFMDSDDTISPSMYQQMYTEIVSTEADIAICNIVKHFEKNGKKQKLSMVYMAVDNHGLPEWKIMQPANPKQLTPSEVQKIVLVSPHYAPNKLYRAAFLKARNLRFDSGKLYEDVLFGLRCLLEATKVCYLDIYPYLYLIRPDSSVRTVSERHFVLFELFQRISDYLETQKLKQQLSDNFIFFVYYNILWHYKQVPFLKRRKFVSGAQKWLPPQTYEKLRGATILCRRYQVKSFIFSVKATPEKNIKKICLFGIKISVKGQFEPL